jgi:hypothetical protein
MIPVRGDRPGPVAPPQEHFWRGSEMERPRCGDLVVYMSGKRFGTVQALNGEALAVEADTGDTVWLRESALFDVGPGKVKLVCEARGLRDYVVPAAPLHS